MIHLKQKWDKIKSYAILSGIKYRFDKCFRYFVNIQIMMGRFPMRMQMDRAPGTLSFPFPTQVHVRSMFSWFLTNPSPVGLFQWHELAPRVHLVSSCGSPVSDPTVRPGWPFCPRCSGLLGPKRSEVSPTVTPQSRASSKRTAANEKSNKNSVRKLPPKGENDNQMQMIVLDNRIISFYLKWIFLFLFSN